MVHFGEFLKTWSLRSNSVTRQVSFNRTNIQMRPFWWFSNNVHGLFGPGRALAQRAFDCWDQCTPKSVVVLCAIWTPIWRLDTSQTFAILLYLLRDRKIGRPGVGGGYCDCSSPIDATVSQNYHSFRLVALRKNTSWANIFLVFFSW